MTATTTAAKKEVINVEVQDVPKNEEQNNEHEIIVTTEFKEKCQLAEWFPLKLRLEETLEECLWKNFEDSDEERNLKQQKESSKWVCRETPRVDAYYEFLENISKGQDSSLEIVRQKATGGSFVCRVIYKNAVPKNLKPKLFDLILQEIALLWVCKDLNCMGNIFEVFENEDSVMLITTWCPRGDLESMLLGDGRCITEQEIQRLFANMIEILYPFHQIGIAHGDIKAEKFLLRGDIANYFSREYENELLFSDYSMVKKVYRRNKPFSNTFQDYFFFAPEMYNNNEYEKPSDIWAMGIILFIMKYGYPPFLSNDENKKQFEKEMEKLITGGFVMNEEYSKRGPWIPSKIYASYSFKDLLKSMLAFEATDRVSIDEILDHPWMMQYSQIEDLKNSLCRGIYEFCIAPEYVRKTLWALFKNNYFDSQHFKMVDDCYKRVSDLYNKNKISIEEFLPLMNSPYILKLFGNISEDQLNEFCTILQMGRPGGADLVFNELIIVKYLSKSRQKIKELNQMFEKEDPSETGKIEQLVFNNILEQLIGKQMESSAIELMGMQYVDISDSGKMNINYKEFMKPFFKSVKKFEIDFSSSYEKYFAKVPKKQVDIKEPEKKE